MHYRGTLIEGMGSTGKEIAHQMTLTPSEDELGIMAVLNVCPQQGFHILFGILRNLLKLIYGNDIGLFRVFQIMENLFQGDERLTNVT